MARVSNKKKKTILIAGVLVTLLALTGTYAWNSISQKARNENIVYSNPGGRLHDDWNGSISRVYAENYAGTKADGSVDQSAAPIFVRVKLQEYMEFGDDAGVKTDQNGNLLADADRKVSILFPGSSIHDTRTWSVYHYDVPDVFQTYVDMVMGEGKSVNYMPTFNKNNKSLEADINGTYEGTIDTSGNVVHFGDYRDYDTLTSETDDEYYYLEGAGNAGTVAGNVPGSEKDFEVRAGQTHYTKTTLQTEDIYTMEEWIALPDTQKIGNFWVYDDDGWAYWASPLEPGEATGPLLTEAKLKAKQGPNCYYAVYATGEFASAGDWGEETTANTAATGFYQNGITDNALMLLTKAANLPDAAPGYPWSSLAYQIKKIEAGSSDTITIDETEFYVLAKQDDKALLMQKQVEDVTMAYGASSNKWEESNIRAYLNKKESGGWLYQKPTLQEQALSTTIHTIAQYDNGTLVDTTDQVFLLSEADVFGTSGATTVRTGHYTTGAKIAEPADGWIAYDSSGTAVNWWLRSPCANAAYLADVHTDGTAYAAHYSTGSDSTTKLYIRPVLWVNL